MSELPMGWTLCQLSDIGEIVTGKTPNTKERSFYGGEIPFIKPGDLDHGGPITSTEVNLTEAGLSEVPTLPPNSIVVTCIGNLGKTGITTKISAANQQINAVIPDKNCHPKYIFHYCKTLKDWLEKESSATTISIVNKGIFSTAPIPIAPLAEQARIAEKLDSLLAQVDTLKTRLDALPALIKRFRQSVLAAAVSGKLTEDWRANKPDTSWNIVKVADIASKEKYSLGIGPFGSNLKVSDYRDHGHPLIFVREIRSNSFEDAKTKFVSSEKFDELYAHRAKPGDILITKMGDPPGDVCIYPKDRPEAVITADCIKLRTEPEIAIKEFICYSMRSQDFRSKVIEISAGVAQQKVNLGNFKKLEISIPYLEEQKEIVRRVEQLFAFADQLETRLSDARKQVDNLTQSILTKAFRGELVPQDPSDEPASALLARISAQRAAAPKPKRGRKAAASKA